MHEKFGKYELLRRLAFGGMAEIFLAALRLEQGFEKRVVLKRILPHFCGDPVFVQMFVDEAVLAARLNHPNIVQVYDFGNVEGTYYIAMEWIDGVDLRAVLRAYADSSQRLSAAEVASIGEGVARGLSYAHNFCGDDGRCFNIVHRDISPHNIMLSKTGEAKVMDFGIAKAEARASRTATGTIKGKLAYMAPEHASGMPLDRRADQFSLGIVLWECLTGERLFRGDSDLEVMRRVLECDVRPVQSLRPDVPEPLAHIVMRMLSPEAKDRYEDLAEAERDLAAFRFSLGAAGVTDLGRLAQSLDSAAGAKPSSQTLVLPEGTEPATVVEPATDTPQATTAERPKSLEHAQSPEEPSAPLEAGSNTSVEVAATSLWTWGIVAVAMLAAVSAAGWRAWRVHQAPTLVQVEALTVDLLVESDPVGAQVLLDGADVGLRTPATLPALEVGSVLTIELRHPGHEPWRRAHTVSARESVLRKTLQLKAPPAAATPVEPENLGPAPVGSPSAGRAKAMRTQTVRPAAVKQQPGSLSLRTTGAWAEVYLGDRRLGVTPLSQVELPAGKHRLLLKNAAAGIEQPLDIQILPGQEERRTVVLR